MKHTLGVVAMGCLLGVGACDRPGPRIPPTSSFRAAADGGAATAEQSTGPVTPISPSPWTNFTTPPPATTATPPQPVAPSAGRVATAPPRVAPPPARAPATPPAATPQPTTTAAAPPTQPSPAPASPPVGAAPQPYAAAPAPQPAAPLQPGASPPTWPAASTLAQHGGLIALPQVLYAEVVPQPDGRLTVFVRDARRAPVQAQEVRLMLRHPGGATEAVALGYDPARTAYTGRVAGVPAGAYALEVGVKLTAESPPAYLITPPVQLQVAASPPPARHGGAVQMVGDNAMEAVVDQSGQVALYWTDAQGAPVPPAQVGAREVTIAANGRSVTVPLQPAGDHLEARVPARLPPSVTVTVPSAQLGATRFQNIVARATPVVAPAATGYGGGPPAPGVGAAPGLRPPMFQSGDDIDDDDDVLGP